MVKEQIEERKFLSIVPPEQMDGLKVLGIVSEESVQPDPCLIFV